METKKSKWNLTLLLIIGPIVLILLLMTGLTIYMSMHTEAVVGQDIEDGPATPTPQPQ